MAKSKKQEVVNKDFSFNNIKKANKSENFVGKKTEDKPKKKLKGRTVWLNFGVHKECKYKFLSMYLDYKELNEFYSLDVMDFFSLSCNFLIKKYKEENVFEESTISFEKFAFRAGKRGKTDRSPNQDEKENIRISISQEVYKKFKNLTYTFVKLFHNSNYTNDCYSKGFFFYDFVDELHKNKKEFMKYKDDEIQK